MTLNSYTPGHWINVDLGLSTYTNDNISWLQLGPTEPTKEFESLTKNANFLGFPFAAYFSVYEIHDTGYLRVSGISWLWVLVDLAFILGSLVIVHKINKKTV